MVEFRKKLIEELHQLHLDELPLQPGLSNSGYVLGETRQVMLIDVADDSGFIYLEAAIFYYGVIAACSCADDPTPSYKNSEYCEVQLHIDKITAETRVSLLES